jgi:hypothetical protein
MLDKADQSTLNSLRWHWDTAYAINCDGRIWTAIPVAARAMRSNATAVRWAGFSSL